MPTAQTLEFVFPGDCALYFDLLFILILMA